MKHLLITASTIAISCIQPALADEIFDLGTITVFANKSGQETGLDRTGTTVEIITKKELEQVGETTVAEFLTRLPGLSASANGGLGSNTNLRVRGLDGKYIKILVDGIDVTDPSSTQTQFDWGGLTTSNILQIEILKGSSSSIYGSRAIAGVVNITTHERTGEPGTQVTLNAEGGSFSTYRSGATITTQSERGGLSFSLNHVKTDGFSARAGATNTEADGYEATQLNFSGNFQATDALKLGLSGLVLNSEGDYDEFGGDGLAPYDEYNTTKTRALRAYAELQTGAVQHIFSVSTFKIDRTSNSNGFATPFLGKRLRADYTGVYQKSDALTYSFGIDWERESFESGADQGETDNTGIFGEVLYAPNSDLDLAASLRYDDHSTFGDNLSGRLAAAYRIGAATTVRAVAATGFRAPSLYELNSTFYGNTALQPEKSTSFELGIEQNLGGGSFVKATAFSTKIDNLIQFVQTSPPFPAPFTGQYQQIAGRSNSKGIELSGEWVLSDAWTMFGNYTYTDAKDATGTRLIRVPKHDLVLGVDTEFATDWNANLSLRYVKDRPTEFGTVMKDYTVVNAALSYDFSDSASAYLRIENLFNQDYQTSASFAASGRALYVGLRANF